MTTSSRNLRIAIQADLFESLTLENDTTYALALAAQERGYLLFHYPPNRLSFKNGRVRTEARSLKLNPRTKAVFSYGDWRPLDLASEIDVILMRQDPPFDIHYISITHLLDTIASEVLILNNPRAVRNAPEKLSILDFQDLLPETAIAFSLDEVENICRSIGDCVVKPLFGNGGESITRIKPNDLNRRSIIEILFRAYTRQPLMIQEYLPAIRKGDRRIILLDGEPCGALDRIPPANDNRANLHVGGKACLAKLSAADEMICQRLAPWLRDEGLFFCGIDVIGDKLTEINVTSPTGIVEIKDLGGADIASLFWPAVEKKLDRV